MSASGGEKVHFSVGKSRNRLSVILSANYAANALFHVMGMQDPMITSRAHVTVVEKKMDKVPAYLGEVS